MFLINYINEYNVFYRNMINYVTYIIYCMIYNIVEIYNIVK